MSEEVLNVNVTYSVQLYRANKLKENDALLGRSVSHDKHNVQEGLKFYEPNYEHFNSMKPIWSYKFDPHL